MLVSAALSEKGASWELVRMWYGGAFELLVSYELLYELEVVLLRAKFRRADYLVSGGSDLRDLEEQGLPAVVSPRRFADLAYSRNVDG